ncbi:hypothetical protein N7492_007470 [Penicillium capsulatum]|uniref:Mid2 domain-containing protein n=1 Tax=Penicillium capsulatum TaxID=69766 RepID=A0A9W9LLU8_9EURO|nr:hypothetical protein N7492_007470 [Penicillium capsulatum]KAJ6117302.1 hypothetical protein N7512_007027 [Penicillium capsulatum]
MQEHPGQDTWAEQHRAEPNVAQSSETTSSYDGSENPNAETQGEEQESPVSPSVNQHAKILDTTSKASDASQSSSQETLTTSTDTSTSSASSTTDSLIPSSTSTPSSSSPSIASITPSESSTSATLAATSDASTANSKTSSGLSPTNTKIAIAVPVAVVGLLIVLALLWFFLRRRRRQRDELPSYDVAAGQTPAVSTAKLMGAPMATAPESAAATMPRMPLLDAPETSSSDDRSPVGSAGQMSARSGPHDSQPELGLAVAVPLHHRHTATEQDMHRVSRAASVADTLTPHLRLPFENSPDDDDAVSVMSNERRRERDVDDMSSVSSFEDDDDRNEHSRTNGNGNWPLR